MIIISDRDLEVIANVIDGLEYCAKDSNLGNNQKRMAKLAVRRLRRKMERLKVKQK